MAALSAGRGHGSDTLTCRVGSRLSRHIGVIRSGPSQRTVTCWVPRCVVAPRRSVLGDGGGIPGNASNGAAVSYVVPSAAFSVNVELNTQSLTVTERLETLRSVKATETG